MNLLKALRGARAQGLWAATFRVAAISLILLGPAASLARAAQTQSLRDDSYGEFSQGDPQSIGVTSDGYLIPGYERRTIGDSQQEIVWDAVPDGAEGAVVCATGHHGRLVRVKDDQTTHLLAEVPEPELTALLRLKDGALLAAGAPGGRIYRIGADDAMTTWCQVQASIVWRMVQDAAGDVWIATGTEGKLFRAKPGEGSAAVTPEEMFDARSANLLDLWIDAGGLMGDAGAIYLAGQNPGWLYRFAPGARAAEVVYNAEAEEIRAIAPVGAGAPESGGGAKPAADGAQDAGEDEAPAGEPARGLILALNTERAPTAQALSLTLRMTGLRAAAGRPGAGGSPAGGTPPSGEGASGDAARQLGEAFSATPQAGFGAPRSELVLLEPEGFARKIWSAPERPIHSIAPAPAGGMLVAAGSQGRLFEATLDGEHALMADLREDYIVRLAPTGEALLMTTARNGLVLSMNPRRVQRGVFLSRVLDAESPARWGNFFWQGDAAGRDGVKVAFRGGNDGDAESELWGPWSGDASAPAREPLRTIDKPVRYLQYRVTIEAGEAAESPRFDAAEVFFSRPNGAPVITQITAVPGTARAAGARPPMPPPTPSSSSPGSSSGSPGSQPSPGSSPGGPPSATPPAGAPRANSMLFTISWKASDPNDDELQYALYFRASDEQEWKLIEDELSSAQMPLAVNGIADGRYRFKVVVSDDQDNPPGQGLAAERVSDEIIVDNTAPRIEEAKADVSGRSVTLRLRASDEVSLLGDAKIDVDNGDALPLATSDGLLDDRAETFVTTLSDLEDGEHVATFNVTDRNGNTVVTKVIFMIEP